MCKLRGKFLVSKGWKRGCSRVLDVIRNTSIQGNKIFPYTSAKGVVDK